MYMHIVGLPYLGVQIDMLYDTFSSPAEQTTMH